MHLNQYWLLRHLRGKTASKMKCCMCNRYSRHVWQPTKEELAFPLGTRMACRELHTNRDSPFSPTTQFQCGPTQ